MRTLSQIKNNTNLKKRVGNKRGNNKKEKRKEKDIKKQLLIFFTAIVNILIFTFQFSINI